MMGRSQGLAAITFLFVLFALAPAAQADFGFNSLSAGFLDEDGHVEQRAGAHPYEWRLAFAMNQDGEERPEGTLRELIFDLPPGMVGNPMAVPRCTGAEFVGQIAQCPGNTQVGLARIRLFGLEDTAEIPVFNLTPPLGVPASFGFQLFGLNSFQEASLRTGADLFGAGGYAASVSNVTVPNEPIQSIDARIWGVPAFGDLPGEGHYDERTCIVAGSFVTGCASDAAEVPLLSLPTSCAGPLKWTVRVSSVEEPEAVEEDSVESVGLGGAPAGLNTCSGVPFAPKIKAQPEVASSDSATGFKVNLEIPQTNSPNLPATAHLKDTVVTLPAGMAVNPSSADGLGTCSLSEIGLGGTDPAQCPDNSKVGRVLANSPLLDHPVSGSVYLAKQGENPFGSLIAIYVALNDPLTGVVVKLAGKVEPDPVTGQLRTTFLSNPQLPVESFDFEFFGGPRAPLTTPPTCGTYATTAKLTPWSSPEGADVTLSTTFPISSSPAGPCPATEAQMPHSPSFEAGTVEPLAGAYSPFVVKLTRENGSQRIGALNTTLPTGVAANFTGIPECSEAQIAQAASRGNPGQGALEKASPSCPAASQIGAVNVGAGSGNPLYVQGNVYLAGPYKGAPFSLAIITPGIAGPFDIGTVVVRAALYVNPETGQGTVRSDPVPSILQGIPLDVRSIAVRVDRSGYVLNPTSCEEKQVTGEAISTTGAVAQLRNRFQVGGCKGLDYTPKLSLQMKGAVRRSGHPALKAVLTQPSGQANNQRTVVILPPTTFIDQNHIANPCTRPQFAEGKCPPASVLGKARVFTPLLAKPLEGPVYFRANGGERDLPDVVVDLHGQVDVIAVGFVDAVTKKGSESSRVRTIFANLPDAPITKAVFSFKGGKKGVFVNSANLCKAPPIATVKMVAHNNKMQSSNQRIATSCKK